MVANKATARKLAVLYYNAITKGIDYVELGVNRYNEQYKQTVLRALIKRAKELDFQLVPLAAD